MSANWPQWPTEGASKTTLALLFLNWLPCRLSASSSVFVSSIELASELGLFQLIAGCSLWALCLYWTVQNGY